jgi:hypothetical protein
VENCSQKENPIHSQYATSIATSFDVLKSPKTSHTLRFACLMHWIAPTEKTLPTTHWKSVSGCRPTNCGPIPARQPRNIRSTVLGLILPRFA